MPSFQLLALALAAVWLFAVAVWFRKSTPFLLGGLLALSALTIGAVATGAITLEYLALAWPPDWTRTLLWTAGGLAALLLYSPAADWIATRVFTTPPTLDAFRAIQESKAKLIAGIVVAWVLGAVLEELVFRGVVLTSVESYLSPLMPAPVATTFAILAAAGGAAIAHLYQGARAALIIGQLSVLFGLLFWLSGYNLIAVMLAHGLYDTIAFMRFASGKSKYAKLDQTPRLP